VNKKALVISGIAWNATYQRHHLNSTILSELGYEVDFLQSCKSSKFSFGKIFDLVKKKISRKNIDTVNNFIPKSINVISCKLLPPSGAVSLLINFIIFHLFLKPKLQKKYDTIIIYTPTDHVNFLATFKAKKVIYDCVRAFSEWGGYHASLYKNERSLLDSATVVLCDSFYLKDVHLPSISHNIEVFQLIPPIEVNKQPNQSISPKIKTIGYFGSISDHIDIIVFNKLIANGYDVLFWGIDDLAILPNQVRKFGYIPDQNTLLSSLIKECDALIIPYNKPLNGVYPAKLSLSFCSGLPVFCSEFYDSLALSSLLYTYKSHDDLLKKLTIFNIKSHTKRNKKVDEFTLSLSIDNYKYKFKEIINAKN
jgi:hypothetical protein